MKGRSLTHQVLAEFREHLILEERSVATVDKYIRATKVFCEYLCGKEVTKETVIAYKNRLTHENYAVRSINSMLAY